MKRSYLIFAGMVLLSLLLGVSSAWPKSGPPPIAPMLAHSAVLLAALALFFVILPKFMGQATQIFVAMVIGVLTGWGLAAAESAAFVADYLGIFGALFIDLLKMVIIPLVFVSLLCGVAGLGDLRKLGSMGARTLAYFLLTTTIAVLIGLMCVNLIHPGQGHETILQEETAVQDDAPPSFGAKIQHEVLPKIVSNPIMSGQPILTVIFFALLLGAALAAGGDKADPALKFFKSIDAAMITLVHWIMLLAPIGVFTLMAKAVASMGIEYIASLAMYCFTVLLGLSLHWCILVFVLLVLFGRISPLRFIPAMAPAFQLAFSTSSSTATLPVSIDCATARLGLRRDVSSFVLPLGATINMDGTALYQAVASLFIAEVYGLDLSIPQQLMVFFTAVTVSVGAAGIPGASVGMMSIVLAAAGIPVEGVGIVIGVDRILDMCRTFVNVTGDCVATAIVTRAENTASTDPT